MQNTDGSYPTTATEDKIVPLASTSNGFWINDKFAGYHAVQYRTLKNTNNNYTNWGNWKDVSPKQPDGYYGTSAVSFTKYLEIRYACTDYKFNYITNNTSNQIISKDVKYGASLEGYGDQNPGQKPGYYFVGWFADDAFTTRAFFDQTSYNAYTGGPKVLKDKMPDHNDTVYGYWRMERTRVVIVPGSSDVRMGSQALSFRLDYGERIRGMTSLVTL